MATTACDAACAEAGTTCDDASALFGPSACVPAVCCVDRLLCVCVCCERCGEGGNAEVASALRTSLDAAEGGTGGGARLSGSLDSSATRQASR